MQEGISKNEQAQIIALAKSVWARVKARCDQKGLSDEETVGALNTIGYFLGEINVESDGVNGERP